MRLALLSLGAVSECLRDAGVVHLFTTGKLKSGKGAHGARAGGGGAGKESKAAAPWQGARVKAGGSAKKGSKKMRSGPAVAVAPAKAGVQKKKASPGGGKGKKGSDGGILRAKGKRAAVVAKKSKQLAAKARASAGGPARKGKPSASPKSASPAGKGPRKRKA